MSNFVIVGSGPCGLTVAYILSKMKYKVTIIDREESIGGCHQVRRTHDHKFTEHGPRIYLDNYVNFIQILKEMQIDFYDLFTKSDESFYKSSKEMLKYVNVNELLILTYHYICYLFDKEKYKRYTVDDIVNGFSKKAKEYIDFQCKTTDGAGIKVYTMYEYFELINQCVLYDLYEPKFSNDIALFELYKSYLVNRGVIFISNEEINSIHDSNHIMTKNGIIIHFDELIICTPLTDLVSILKRSMNFKNIFGPIDQIYRYARYTNYIPYLSFTLHWNEKIDHSFSGVIGEWKIFLKDISKKTMDPISKTIYSGALVELNIKSKRLNKTANQIDNPSDLINEILIQLHTAIGFKKIPEIILSPAVYRSSHKWNTKDTAYMFTKRSIPFPFTSMLSNIHSVGTHNLRSYIPFTSYESATQNAIHFCHHLKPDSKKVIEIKDVKRLNTYIYNLLIFIIILMCVIIMRMIW